MQALIPIFAILAAAAGEQLTLLPYAYLANPLPVPGHQSRTEVLAYSNPFTKVELQMKRGPFYNYRDPHNTMYYLVYLPGDGFTATIDDNLPFKIDESLSDENNANRKEHAKATANKEEEERASRRKRSLAADNQDHRQLADNPPSSPQEQIDSEPAKASPSPATSSHDEPATQEKKTDADQSGRSATAKSVIAPVYGLPDSIPIPRLAGTAVSHQYRVDIHNNLRLRAVKPVEAIDVLPEPVYQTMYFPDQLVISHQNRIQMRENVETPAKDPETEATGSTTPSLPDRWSLNENRPHGSLGQEDRNHGDAVKTDDATPPIETPIAAAPDVTVGETPPDVAVEEALPVITDEEALPVVVTAVSSQSEIRTYRNARLELNAVPTTFASEPTVYVATSHVQPTINWPNLAPVARSSQYRSQIHSSEKVELTK